MTDASATLRAAALLLALIISRVGADEDDRYRRIIAFENGKDAAVAAGRAGILSEKTGRESKSADHFF